MSRALDAIRAPIETELVLFEQRFRDAMKSRVALLDTIMTYIVKRKGKQLRPMLVLLSAKLYGPIRDDTYRGASLVELLHTATLVHDDVVDESDFRRGFFSINALWKNKIAVLVGDYLLSKGLLLALENDDFASLKILSEAVRQMSEGELLQLEKSRKLNLSEDVYYDIIEKKTASLLASCCAIGARSTSNDETVVNDMRNFGRALGMAFQIKDDLFDFNTDRSGKPKGIDIKEKKLTLPVIYALNNAEKSEQRKILRLIRQKKKSNAELAEIFDFVRGSRGVEYAHTRMNGYKQEAVEILNRQPDNECRRSLQTLLNYVIERER